jgi:mannose-6-phosphate isomerase-like protein (cupin superfamily)
LNRERENSLWKKIVANELYLIKEIEFKVGKNVIATVSITELKVNKATRGHSHNTQKEIYLFLSGSGIIRRGANYKIVSGSKKSIEYVSKGEYHRVFNTSDKEKLIFITLCKGKVQRPCFK